MSLRSRLGRTGALLVDTGAQVMGSALDAVDARLSGFRDARMASTIDEKLAKASPGKGGDPSDPMHALKSLFSDPLDMAMTGMGYRERPTMASYAMMEYVGSQMPVVTDVVRTRILQVEPFLKPQEERNGPGFVIQPRSGSATGKGVVARKRQEEISQGLLRCGFCDEDKRDDDPVSFQTFGKMLIRDSLIFDQATFEVVPDRRQRPSYWTIVDPTTIRLVDPEDRRGKDSPFAVQVLRTVVHTDYLPGELAFCVRNPRSGLHTYGYGEGEIETMVKEVTSLLWGIDYNRNFFKQGTSARGILNFKGGTVPNSEMTRFRRQWYAMMSGVHNAWRTPILNAQELQWINLQMSNRDMEYSAWMDFLIKIVCARFHIAPEEVNFQYGNTGQASAMSQAPFEEKLKASRDLGLRPLVDWFYEQMNRHVLWRLDPDLEVVAKGFDHKGAEAELELHKAMASSLYFLDEVRDMRGEPPLPDGLGQVILDPTWLQYQQAKAAAMMGPGEEAPDGQAPEGDDVFDLSLYDGEAAA